MATAQPPESGEATALPEEYLSLPLRALRMSARRKFAKFLDLEGTLIVAMHNGLEIDIENGFSGMAELAGFDYHDIMNFKRSSSPTMQFLEAWTDNATIGNLWKFLITLERYDVISDCRRCILNDCKVYQKFQIDRIQDPTVTNSDMIVDETKYATRDDVISGTRTKYDAFLCYTQEEADIKFVKNIIRVLEVERGLKLFVPGRDDLPGAAQNSVSAYLIERRCKRVVILISRAFLQSSACDFQVRFAQALSPGARSKRLIPIILEKGVLVPRILRFLAACDFTKTDMIDWIWDRLESAIKAPMGPETFFEPEDEENPFRPDLNINLTDWRPLDEIRTIPPVSMDNIDEGSGTYVKQQPQTPPMPPAYDNGATESSWSSSTQSQQSITDNRNTSSSSSSSSRPPTPQKKLTKKKSMFRNPLKARKKQESTSRGPESASMDGCVSMGQDALQCMSGSSMAREPGENSYYFSREGNDRAAMSMRSSLSDNEMQRDPVESSYHSAMDHDSEQYVFV
ncbi:hypothetical protein DPMN_056281 [Dreissena polymorpha]|uniref:TIR domain-containing protein n=1 Tax=Dreissena polymorpha TaxID=45954 RepID=A0A9D4CU23_DREPO|nr:hypothetical protein DPMN_056281 [Dreissena polymorpha]